MTIRTKDPNFLGLLLGARSRSVRRGTASGGSGERGVIHGQVHTRPRSCRGGARRRGAGRGGHDVPYQATYVEPVGGPNQSPFSCPSGTSCGSANISGIGHASYQVVTFNACGFGCHLRAVTFDDGSTLLIQIEDQPSGFAFTSPGNSGSHGYIGFPQGGNPQFLEIKETILSGTGQLAGASGSGTGTVKLHGGVAIGKTSGTITLP